MSLRDITREAVEKAIDEYKNIGQEEFLKKYGYRPSLDYWLIDKDGNRYVSKAIVGAAHGFIGPGFSPLSYKEFKGGQRDTRKCLVNLGFKVASSIEFKPPLSGAILSNAEISSLFGVGNMGGMRRNTRVPHLVIISDPFTGLYEDRWESNVLHYTGMGKIGDQSLTFSQNKTLNLSPQTGEPVYLFEAREPGAYTFLGEVKLAGQPYRERQPDENGDVRDVWMFPVQLKDSEVNPVWSDSQVRKLKEEQERNARRLSNDELRKRAEAANKKSSKKQVLSVQRYRDPAIAEHVKRLANGRCDLCQQPAPFHGKNGDPFLECHHIVWLANDGDDSIENAVALCPNCHRKMHALNLKSDQQKLHARVKRREA